jgi:hypothetical protein
MAFGWSAGDILSAINFIIEIAKPSMKLMAPQSNSEKQVYF